MRSLLLNLIAIAGLTTASAATLQMPAQPPLVFEAVGQNGDTASAFVVRGQNYQFLVEPTGAETMAVLRRVDPDAAFAWRDGELVYRDQPLADVIEDLNRYYATPVRLEGPSAATRFSGVLKLATREEAVVVRLQGFVHGTVERRPDAIVLRLQPAG
mgnify:CR=1 FL=1